MTNEILEAAKKYCENHIFIFPVGENKKPHTPHGLKDATNDYNKFLEFYKPGDQVAILTGLMNNIYVIDCDVEKDSQHKPVLKDGKIINTGEQNFISQFINKNNAEKFKTKTIKTQTGGLHLYYKLKNGQDPLKTHIAVLPKVDLKGEGGYVVAPPSAGQYGQYEIVDDVQIADMPDELYEFWHDLDLPDDSNEIIRTINFNDSNLFLLIKTLADIFKSPNGRGNELLMAFAGAMALRGVSIEHTKEIIKEAAKLNHWSKIDYGVIDNSYNKVKNNQKVLGFTTFKNDLIENKENYEDFNGIIKNLESIFEHRESPFYDVDDHGIKKFNKAKSIEFVRKKYPDLYTDDTDVIYYFSIDDGWHEGVETEIAAFIQGSDEAISEHNLREIISGIKHLTFDQNFKLNKPPNTLIPIPAGLYNVETKKLEPHNNQYFYKTIKRNYIPGVKQKSLAFDDFLSKVLVNPDRDKISIYESIAWGFLNVNDIQGMIIYFGEGGNGKGIIQNDVIPNLLGSENVASPDLDRIANYAFELANLINKRMLLFSESIKGVTYNWNIMKRVTGHDFENIPIKNKPAILSRYQSAVILSTNELIPPRDELAIWRRIINIIEFNNYLSQFASSEIEKIDKGLITDAELDRLFSFILESIYPQFLISGFSNRYNLKTAKQKYLIKSNPAIAYITLKENKGKILTDPDEVIEYCNKHGLDPAQCIITNRDGTTTIFQVKAALIRQVNQFCKANHLPRYDEHDRNSQTKLGQAINYLNFDVQNFDRHINGKRILAWAGIFVTPDDEYLKIDDNEGKHPEQALDSNEGNNENQDGGHKPDNPQNSGTLSLGNDGDHEPETDGEKREEKTDNDDTGVNPHGNSPGSDKSAGNEANKKEENGKREATDNPDIIYRKSEALATNIPFLDVFQRGEYNYYAIDKSQNDTNSKAWNSYIMKSQEITAKEFYLMKGDRK